MDLIVSWVGLPTLLLTLSLGCGLLVGALAGTSLPRTLVPGCGLAVIIVAGQFLTLADATAELAVPAVVALALAGLWLGLPITVTRRDLAVAGVALATLVCFAAPIVLSGQATFAGFIRLDDTATWLALTDRLMEHGRSLDGLAPSSYEATLALNLGEGYPVGVFVPLGVATTLLGTDAAWLIQPYMAVVAVILALSLWSLAGALVRRRSWRALAAILGAQSALLYGYYLWGGVKEIAAAALIATAAALAGRLVGSDRRAIRLVPLALVAGALVGVISVGGLIWLAPILIGAAALSLRDRGIGELARDGAWFSAALAAAATPVIVAGGVLPPTSSPLTDDAAQGNLIGPLAIEQVAGVWPSGDFRLAPTLEPLVYLLIAFVAVLAVVGLTAAARGRATGPLLYLVASLGGCLAILAVGSPWVDAKALATASPAIPFVAVLGANWLATSVSTATGWIAIAIVAGGVVWSNALAYRDVNLAPRDQLAELERIGELIAGEGPALMTEYQPYGVRHFLRGADPEGISELRRREIPLRDGELVAKGLSADTDAIDPTALEIYRTLVLRRSPSQSRPPPPYELIWQGHSYEAWRRPDGAEVAERIPLGGRFDPHAQPGCRAVGALARHGDLIAAQGGARVVVSLSRARFPLDWAPSGTRHAPRPDGAGTITATVEIDTPGEYRIWLGGSLRPEVEALVDGEPAGGSVSRQLNNLGQYVELGSVTLDPGEHTVEIRIGDADLSPGSGGAAAAVGPLVLSQGEAAETRLLRVRAARYKQLCGREWDWIELAGAGG